MSQGRFSRIAPGTKSAAEPGNVQPIRVTRRLKHAVFAKHPAHADEGGEDGRDRKAIDPPGNPAKQHHFRIHFRLFLATLAIAVIAAALLHHFHLSL